MHYSNLSLQHCTLVLCVFMSARYLLFLLLRLLVSWAHDNPVWSHLIITSTVTLFAKSAYILRFHEDINIWTSLINDCSLFAPFFSFAFKQPRGNSASGRNLSNPRKSKSSIPQFPSIHSWILMVSSQISKFSVMESLCVRRWKVLTLFWVRSLTDS